MAGVDIKKKVVSLYGEGNPYQISNKELDLVTIDGKERYILHLGHWESSLDARTPENGIIFTQKELETLNLYLSKELERKKQQDISDQSIENDKLLEEKEKEGETAKNKDRTKEMFVKDLRQQKRNGPVTFSYGDKENERRKEDIGIEL